MPRELSALVVPWVLHQYFGSLDPVLGDADMDRRRFLQYGAIHLNVSSITVGPNLDGEIDEVGVDEDVVRGAEGSVVSEEHGRRDLLHVVCLRRLLLREQEGRTREIR